MISIIIPVYNEEKSLKVLQTELNQELNSLGKDYEIIYVDDGSVDESPKIIRNLVQTNNNVKLIQFKKHYGQTEAMQAGIDNSAGDALIFIDADLQNDPKDIPRFLQKLEEGFDVVSGWRRKREDPFFSRRLPSLVANFLISQLSKVKLHDYGCTLKAYRKEIIKNIRLYGQMHRYIPIYASRLGASIAEVEVSSRKRFFGKSKYNLMRVPNVILDFLVAEFINKYMNKPMYIFGNSGLVLLLLGMATGALIVVRKLFLGGLWVSPLLFIMLLLIIVGFQFILMGFLAEIFIRFYYQNSGDSTYYIREIIEKERK